MPSNSKENPDLSESFKSYHSDERAQGPIEILCKEIDFRFERHMENDGILVAFVKVLVSQVAHIRDVQANIAGVIGKEPPSDDSASVLVKVGALLELGERGRMLSYAAEVHRFIDEVEGSEDGPCDHLIDMLSSCVAAIRFGLERPCHSRHAAAAAQHIWKHVYGVSLFDRFTPAWEKDWTRAQLQEAILQLALRSAKATASTA